jgi:hypothetical protein
MFQAHAHGGHWDPNSIGNVSLPFNASMVEVKTDTIKYNQTPPPVHHQSHGGAYTPGSSVVVRYPPLSFFSNILTFFSLIRTNHIPIPINKLCLRLQVLYQRSQLAT